MPEVKNTVCKGCKKKMGESGSKSPLCKECRAKLTKGEFKPGKEAANITGSN